MSCVRLVRRIRRARHRVIFGEFAGAARGLEVRCSVIRPRNVRADPRGEQEDEGAHGPRICVCGFLLCTRSGPPLRTRTLRYVLPFAVRDLYSGYNFLPTPKRSLHIISITPISTHPCRGWWNHKSSSIEMSVDSPSPRSPRCLHIPASVVVTRPTHFTLSVSFGDPLDHPLQPWSCWVGGKSRIGINDFWLEIHF